MSSFNILNITKVEEKPFNKQRYKNLRMARCKSNANNVDSVDANNSNHIVIPLIGSNRKKEEIKDRIKKITTLINKSRVFYPISYDYVEDLNTEIFPSPNMIISEEKLLRLSDDEKKELIENKYINTDLLSKIIDDVKRKGGIDILNDIPKVKKLIIEKLNEDYPSITFEPTDKIILKSRVYLFHERLMEHRGAIEMKYNIYQKFFLFKYPIGSEKLYPAFKIIDKNGNVKCDGCLSHSINIYFPPPNSLVYSLTKKITCNKDIFPYFQYKDNDIKEQAIRNCSKIRNVKRQYSSPNDNSLFEELISAYFAAYYFKPSQAQFYLQEMYWVNNYLRKDLRKENNENKRISAFVVNLNLHHEQFAYRKVKLVKLAIVRMITLPGFYKYADDFFTFVDKIDESLHPDLFELLSLTTLVNPFLTGYFFFHRSVFSIKAIRGYISYLQDNGYDINLEKKKIPLTNFLQSNYNYPTVSKKSTNKYIKHGYIEVYNKSGKRILLNRYAPIFNNTSFLNAVTHKNESDPGDTLHKKINEDVNYLSGRNIMKTIGKAYLDKDYKQMLLLLRSCMKPKSKGETEYIPLPEDRKIIVANQYYRGITKLRNYMVLNESETSYKIINDYGNSSWFKKRRFVSINN